MPGQPAIYRSHSVDGRQALPAWQSSGRRWTHILALTVAVLALMAGTACRMVDEQKLNSKSPLSALERTADQAQLDVMFVRIAEPDFQTAGELWAEVDEQAIPAKLRRGLEQNGFRAGLVGSQLPPRVSAILQTAQSVDGDGAEATDSADDAGVGATRRKMFLRRGQRGELIASSVQPEFHVLQSVRGEVQGRSYRDGQGQFSIKATPTDDGRVKLQMAPEVHYGEFRNRYVPGEGMFRLDTSRRKHLFDQLRIEVDLAVGQIIVIGAQPGRPGSLGHRFFNEQAADKSVSKLLMIHVNEIGTDE